MTVATGRAPGMLFDYYGALRSRWIADAARISLCAECEPRCAQWCSVWHPRHARIVSPALPAGFPPHTYELEFPAPGDPALAARIIALLTDAGVETRADPTRGYDHGVFIPLMLVFPDADVPVVQVSLHSSLDPTLHARIGAALAPLRREGILLLGSGATTHNLGQMRSSGWGATKTDPAQAGFVSWLTETVVKKSGVERLDRLTRWRKEAPGFRVAHPREEHVLPIIPVVAAASLDVAVGADGRISEAATAGVAADGSSVVAGAGAAATGSGGERAVVGAGRVIHEAWAMGNMAQHAFIFE